MDRSPVHRRRRVQDALRTLWGSLCEAHGLRAAERSLLKRVARELGFASPAVMFFRPGAFADDLERRRPGGRRAALRTLGRALFSDGPPDGLAERGPLGDDGLPRRFAPDELEALGQDPRSAAR